MTIFFITRFDDEATMQGLARFLSPYRSDDSSVPFWHLKDAKNHWVDNSNNWFLVKYGLIDSPTEALARTYQRTRWKLAYRYMTPDMYAALKLLLDHFLGLRIEEEESR